MILIGDFAEHFRYLEHVSLRMECSSRRLSVSGSYSNGFIHYSSCRLNPAYCGGQGNLRFPLHQLFVSLMSPGSRNDNHEVCLAKSTFAMYDMQQIKEQGPISAGLSTGRLAPFLGDINHRDPQFPGSALSTCSPQYCTYMPRNQKKRRQRCGFTKCCPPCCDLQICLYLYSLKSQVQFKFTYIMSSR